jgi:hypothetical protein
MTEQRALLVLVSGACRTCRIAYDMARAFARERPDVQVAVQDVDAPGWRAPQHFIGTPMYYVNDRVLSFGNPTREQLYAAFPLKGGPASEWSA